MDTLSYPAISDTASSELQSVWQKCLVQIQGRVTSLSFKTWFQPIQPLKLGDKELTVQVPSQFFYDWVDQHYNDLIRETISAVLVEGGVG